jgi:serine/threonine protein kinase
MITFRCPHCTLMLQVDDRTSGQQARCPACKHVSAVPSPAATVTWKPPDQLDGVHSTLARAGVQGDIDLDSAEPTPAAAPRPSRASLAQKGQAQGQRYVLEGEIGRGGMGTVLRAVDCDIRREVAVKYLLDQADARKKVRFIEEAQITGQLEHPNIVPIHELGVDGKGRLFFTMKMVKGRSLAQVLTDLREVPRIYEKEWPLGRLLTVLVNVCHALAYAHARGVVHRDLKPANIMVGDFGEVYVMDWGLAKVVGSSAPEPHPVAVPAVPAFGSPPPPEALFVFESPSISGGPTARVATNRSDGETDQTQEGSVLGTPAYMAPEQARGRVGDIDQRTDVYALGAILYEMLCLKPPVEKGGGKRAILSRVAEGNILPPQERAPRDRAVPRELSAVALKALAMNKEDRYPSAAAFRQDLERYLEGRSVSAKADSFREAAWKLVKRNRAVSAVTAAAVLVLTFVLVRSSWANYQARREAEKAYADYRQEQTDKEERTRRAVPAFVRSARQVAGEGDFEKALIQIDFALEYDSDNAEAHLLKGQILIAQKDFAAGREQLGRYLRQRPGDADAKKLAELCQGKAEDSSVLFAIAEVFQQQKAYALAARLLQDVRKLVEARKPLLELYQKQVNAAWPGTANQLTLEEDGKFRLDLNNRPQVVSLQPLRGMPLSRLILENCTAITDLSPLEGMPLERLNVYNCPVRDLSPLKGMPMTDLRVGKCSVADLSPLRGMPLASLDLINCNQVRDLSPLEGMKLEALHLGYCKQVSDLSPLKGMPLTWVHLVDLQVSDLSPLRGMKLTGTLELFNCPVRDLSPLRGMKLTGLNLQGTLVSDLSPLKGMPLTRLSLYDCPLVHDLSPLKGMSLTSAHLAARNIRDISALEGAMLVEVWLPEVVDRGMSVLRPMKTLGKINTMPAEEFWKQYDAGEFKQLKP